MQHTKLIVSSVLSALILIVVFQNTEPVETKILFITITMPRAVLLFVTTIIGFALGIMVSFMMMKRGQIDER